MNMKSRSENTWFWLTVPICILLIIAAGCGVFLPGVYRDSASFAAQARGQDLVSLMIVVPSVSLAAWLASRGSNAARLVWLGSLVYLVYTYVVAAFQVKFNPLFLVYVALLGCSVYALIGGLLTSNMVQIKSSFGSGTPIKAVSIYLAVLVALFYSMWLGEALPAVLTGTLPKTVLENGTPTNAVHVLDMAWILPAFAITAYSLWRRQPVGYTLAGASLSYIVLLVSAILGMVVMMIRESQPVFVPQAAIFGILWLISFGMLIWFMRNVRSVPA